MTKFDYVELINENEELRSKNIFKGTAGILVSYISATEEWIILFLDIYNYGAYAVAKAKTTDLKYISKMPEDWIKEFNAKIESTDFYTHTELKPPKFKEYDKVMLINDKPAYTKAGVKKGMTGCVMFNYAISNKWGVIFSEENTGCDIADINVHEDDLELIE